VDDIYRINVAKTEFREAYNTGDVERLLAVFGAGGFIDMSEGAATKYGPEAVSRLRETATELFRQHSVKLRPIISDIVVLGDTAYDYGSHEFTLTPKRGGQVIQKRQRYFETWKRTPEGDWKISLHIFNGDVREEVGSSVSHWFLNEERIGLAPN